MEERDGNTRRMRERRRRGIQEEHLRGDGASSWSP